MKKNVARRFGAIGFVSLVVAFGGGCSSGCSGCGTTPLADGFPIASDVENAASLRLTQHGLAFVNTNLPAIASKAAGGAALQFAIPKTDQSLTVATAHICGAPTATQCIADIDIAGMAIPITVSTPHDLKLTGTIPIKVDDLPVVVQPVVGSSCTVDIGVGSNLSCSGNTPAVDYVNLPISADIAIAVDQTAGHVRNGYSAISIGSISITLDGSNIEACGGGCASFVDSIKSVLVALLEPTLESKIKTELENQLCTKTSTTATPACPTGSNDVSGICRYGTAATDACVSTLIGLDGHEELSSLLSSISSGTTGGFDFALAAGGPDPRTDGSGGAWGDLDPVANGMTLSLVGGALPKPQSTCVPSFDNVIPTGVPVPDEMIGNTLAPWPSGDPGPDVGVALAGRYLDYMFGGLYNSGTLCLGITTDQFSQLQTGLLSVLIPSIKNLTFEGQPAAAAITTRPQKPPTVKIGGGTDIAKDPLLSVSLPQFAIDFYVWNDDRYVRAMTYTADLSIPINLSTHVDPKTNPNGGLLPVLGTIGVTNASVTNSALLTDDPTTIAAGLTSLLGGIAGQLLGSLKPIDLSSSLATYGLAITIPDGAIRKLTKGSDDFVGLFADFSLAKPGATLQADVHASIVSKKIFPEAMSLETADRSKLPALQVQLGSSSNDAAIEYAYAIDHGTHSAWSPARDFTIQNDALFLQGKHVLFVWARRHGEELSESAVPAEVPFIIDVVPPTVKLTPNDDGSAAVTAWDIVSDKSALQMRTRVESDTSEWTAWTSVANIDANALAASRSLTVQVRDEEGNVGSVSSALIRGRADSTLAATGAGCGSCVVGTGSGDSPWGFASVFAGMALLVTRRRRGVAR